MPICVNNIRADAWIFRNSRSVADGQETMESVCLSSDLKIDQRVVDVALSTSESSIVQACEAYGKAFRVGNRGAMLAQIQVVDQLDVDTKTYVQVSVICDYNTTSSSRKGVLGLSESDPVSTAQASSRVSMRGFHYCISSTTADSGYCIFTEVT